MRLQAARRARRRLDKWGAIQVLTEEPVRFPAQPRRIGTDRDLAAYVPPDQTVFPVPDAVLALGSRCSHGERAVAAEAESAWASGVYLRGGHIISSGNAISSLVKPADLLAMVRTAQPYGQEPAQTPATLAALGAVRADRP